MNKETSGINIRARLIELKSKTFTLSEDWSVVLLGGLLIVLLLSGLKLPVPEFGWNDFSSLLQLFHFKNIVIYLSWFAITYAILLLGAFLNGKSIKAHALAVPLVYGLSFIALLIAGNGFIKNLGLEAVIFSLVIGLVIRNFISLPEWFKESLSSEMIVKIGLVMLGSGILFSDIMKAGGLGLIQSFLVVLAVWYFAFWLCRKLKIDKELSLMISSAVSICGVSAAIATAGAIKGDSRKLSYVVSMVLITAIPMMLVMPVLAQWMHLSPEITGAWLGGSIDTTGAVVASGSLAGEEALKISTIVKFSQNVLLGIAALLISIYWSYRGKDTNENTEKVNLRIIWQRFPKFILGFVGMSLFFSFFVDKTITKEIGPVLKNFQGLFFTFAFTSIGLETNVRDLIKQNSLKPFYVFLLAQLFNVVFTLVIAYWLFGNT